MDFTRRGAGALFPLWFIVSACFACLYLLPGDPARIILGPQASAESIATFRREAGLNLPLPQQYFRYLGRLGRFDLGKSSSQRRPVLALLGERGLPTLKLTLAAAVFAAGVGLGLPLLAKLLHAEWIQLVGQAVLVPLATTPPYVLGVISLLVFAGWLKWIDVVFDGGNAAGWVVPAIVLGAYPAALVLRLFAARLREELAAPYARMALAHGLSTARVILVEVLPNALPTALAAMTNHLAYFLTGAFFVEVIFGIPGWGRLTQEALRNKDLNLLGGLCLSFAVAVTLLFTALDFFQRKLQPRAQHG